MIDIEEQYDKIYRYCYFRLKNQHLAEDITQETFLRFFESSSYKDTGRPLAYFFLQVELAGICFGISAFLRRGSIGIGLGIATAYCRYCKKDIQ